MYSLRKRAAFYFIVSLLIWTVLTPSLSLRPVAAQGSGQAWRQSNVSGFGDPHNSQIATLNVLGGHLYAGTWNDLGAQVWRTSDGQKWYNFSPPWAATNQSALAAATFNNYLYVGTYREAGAEIWRTNGTRWEQVAWRGLNDVNNQGFTAFAVFANALYVATFNMVTGVEVWRSTTGGGWSQVNVDGFGAGPTFDLVMDTYRGYLYVGLNRQGGCAELWRTANGTSWSASFTNGLGDPNNTHVGAMAEFKGEFYISFRNPSSGGQVWRSSDGLNWTPVFTDGLGKLANSRPYGLITFNNRLYVVFSNVQSGAEVWCSSDGLSWEQVSEGGWGDANNQFADYFDKAAAVFKGSLYIGTMNNAVGGQVWQMLHMSFLPLLLK